MNPVFVFLVLVGAVILWFLLSALFYPFGRFLHRIWKDAADEINREENKEKEEERPRYGACSPAYTLARDR